MSEETNLVKIMEDNLKLTPNKRIGDINILYLAKEVQELKIIIKEKLENGLSVKLANIWDKINSFQCAVEILRIDNIDKEITAIKLLFKDTFVINNQKSQWRIGIIVGIVCSVPAFIALTLEIMKMIK